MKDIEVIYTVARMSSEAQKRFFTTLAQNGVDAEAIEAMMFMVGFFSMKMNPEKERAIKAALAEQLYKEFNRV